MKYFVRDVMSLIKKIMYSFYVGPVNSASWTNQGPQQWDQSGSVDNQSGQFPHSTMPPDQYPQMDQQGQFQHGTVLYATCLCTLSHVSCNI